MDIVSLAWAALKVVFVSVAYHKEFEQLLQIQY